MKKCSEQKGDILISALVFIAIVTIMTIGLVNWGSALLSSVRSMADKEQAFQIAEAGIDYYRWHLAHAQNDFTDGTGNSGAYIHQFSDKDGNIIGSYSLIITPPAIGSTIVKIKSTGTVLSNPNVSRTIQTVLAIPSLAKYAVVANDNMAFGSGTEVFGPIHSNKGIHFDGLAHNLISSAMATYTDPDDSLNEFGVYTKASPADPNPPASVPNRPDIFMAGRQFPIPAEDFSGLTLNLQQLQTLATTSGREFGPSQHSGNPALGYHIVLKTNGTFDLYVVTALVSPGSGCSNSLNQTGWDTRSIQSQSFVANYTFPANGIIFAEDDLWVDGQVNNARLTIAAGKLPDVPSNEPSITVNTNLLYSNYSGNDVIGLIAQGNINIGLMSDNTIRIDGALVAENGRVGRYYYGSSCGSSNSRSSLTLNGMIATNKRYGFAYTDDTGYTTRNLIYDGNLLYGPPPSFPLAGSQYQILSWQELTQ